jgi:hypothetical protein
MWSEGRESLLRLDLSGARRSANDLIGLATDVRTARTVTAARVCTLAPDPGVDIRRLVLAFVSVSDVNDPDDAATLGALLLRLGRPEDAVPQLFRARKLRGEAGTAREDLLLALALARLERDDEARQWYRRALMETDGERRAVLAGALLSGGGPLQTTTLTAAAQQRGDPRLVGLNWQERLEIELLRREAEGWLGR